MNSSPIAVIGLGCVLPDAFSPAALQANLFAGRSAIRDIGNERPHWRRYQSHNGDTADKTHTLLAAPVLNYAFDWRRFRIPPNDAATINPMQLMGLDAGDQALRNVRTLPHETAGVFIGATGCGWQPDSGLHIHLPDFVEAWTMSAAEAGLDEATRDAVVGDASRRLRARLKPVSEDTVVNAGASVIGGRIAMHHDLKGMHYAVDSGYASALAALAVAVRALQDGTVDLAVAGGVSELLTPLELVAFAKLGGLAHHAVSPFDESAEGTLLGEGAAMFALKRLEDAERDGETIHAIVLGVGEATDPPERSLLAPSECGQESALRMAYERAGVSPSSVSFVSCHATGTRLGDVTEVRALNKVFAGHPDRVALCSAKPFVGHLRGASGAVGLLHAILALKASCLPAQINFSAPHPDLALDETPFFVPTRHQMLKKRDDEHAVRAGVSSFGFGGASFHAVLEAHSPNTQNSRPHTSKPLSEHSPIAVVGMGAVMPGAGDVSSFWTRLLEGYDAVTDIPSERWPLERFYHADAKRLDTSYSKLGAFLEKYPEPKASWRMPPASRASIDPEQLVLLQAAEEAVADAGYAEGRWAPERVMVSVGFISYQGKRFLADLRVNYAEYSADLEAALGDAGFDDEARRDLLAATERRFKRGLPPITEDSLVGWLGNIGAARVARRWGFRGAHLCVDSACASSHAALHAAVQALRHGTADVAIVGGVWCDMMPEFYVGACRFNALSPTGITPFDAGADGFVPGEGAGVVVLRRQRDAERDGDRIHALLLGVHGSSDGRGRSVLAPKPEGEAAGMRRALAAAAVSANTVDYVECHGTGTALGDSVEIQAITQAYGPNRKTPLLVGSVKSNYGHLNAAAGLPALIKSVLAVREGIIPPSINCEQRNPDIDFATCPVEVVTRRTDWTTRDGGPRRAGVSGFGVGGTNMHLIVEEYRPEGRRAAPTTRASRSERPPDIAAAGGADVNVCIASLEKLAGELKDVEYSALLADARRRATGVAGGMRVAIVAADSSTLARRLELLRAAARRGGDLSFLRNQGVFVGAEGAAPPVALLFPGQGPQYPGMLRNALERFPTMRRTLDRVDVAYEQIAGRRLSPTFLGDTVPKPEDVHCAVFAVGCVVAEFLKSFGVRADAVAGQSAGELAALVAAGALTLEDGLRAIRERTVSVLELSVSDPGRMIALSCPAQRAAELCVDSGGVAYVAADNSPAASIVSADTPTTRRIIELCAQAGIEATELDVSHGYHSPLIADARPRYERTLRELQFGKPTCEIVSTITGRSVRSLPSARYPKLLAEQFVQPVRLREAIETLHACGIRLFIECGPKWPLTTYVSSTLAGREHEAQATLHPKTGEVEQLHRALACLFVARVTDLDAVNLSSTI